MSHALEDQEGFNIGLYNLRDTSKKEVDFLVTYEDAPWFAVECKYVKVLLSLPFTIFVNA
ncbi:MAG: hypothetical protein QXP27_01510 [Candidatus Methanomethyliaceae archaeon]